MLHTDACLGLLGSGSSDAAFAHLNAAIAPGRRPRTLRDRSSRPFANLWYRSVSAMLMKTGAQVWGSALIEALATRDRISRRAEAAFARGLDMEIMACEVDPGVPVDGFGLRRSTAPEGRGRRFRGRLGPGRFTAQGRAAPGTIPSPDGRARRRPAMARGGHAFPARERSLSRSPVSRVHGGTGGPRRPGGSAIPRRDVRVSLGTVGAARARPPPEPDEPRGRVARRCVQDAGAAVCASIHSGRTSEDPEARREPFSI